MSTAKHRDPCPYNPNVSEIIAQRAKVKEAKDSIKCRKTELKKIARNKATNERRNRISDILEKHNADRLELC